LLKAFGYSAQLAEFHTHTPHFTLNVNDRPTAGPVARMQAQNSSVITNLWHERVHLKPFQQHLLRYLDGQHNRAALMDILTDLAAKGHITIEQNDQPVEDVQTRRDILAQDLAQHLQWLARAALLVG